MDEVSGRWKYLCQEMSVNDVSCSEIWHIIESHYSEPHRFYHTLKHVDDMLRQRVEFGHLFSDKITVDLAIFFHDVIYNPASKSNEEDSAALFVDLFSKHGHSDIVDVEKVVAFIIATKAHRVHMSRDDDLKLFVDIDMSILGSDRDKYAMYAANIRKEYRHIEHHEYCSGRAAFLQLTLALTDSEVGDQLPIFASSYYFDKLESQARDNLAWEYDLLSHGTIPE